MRETNEAWRPIHRNAKFLGARVRIIVGDSKKQHINNVITFKVIHIYICKGSHQTKLSLVSCQNIKSIFNVYVERTENCNRPDVRILVVLNFDFAN